MSKDYPEFAGCMLIAVTELRSKEEIDQLAEEMGSCVMANEGMPLIFERSKSGRIAYSLPEMDVPEVDAFDIFPPEYVRKQDAELPEVSELDLMRHYTKLSENNHGVDSGFYPLGSCTMKYNPKINETVARFPGFAHIHPLQDESTVQGRSG